MHHPTAPTNPKKALENWIVKKKKKSSKKKKKKKLSNWMQKWQWKDTDTSSHSITSTPPLLLTAQSSIQEKYQTDFFPTIYHDRAVFLRREKSWLFP